MQKFPMTPLGHRKLKTELRELKAERPRLADVILAARELGDLSENAEYHAAKEKQGFMEGRIAELETKLALAEVVDPTRLSGDRVVFGATVYVVDVDTEEELSYTIVGDDEADVKKRRISLSSPVARALINHHEGDEVMVRVPGGTRAFEIEKVRFEKVE